VAVRVKMQWRRYTRARQVKWPSWKIHRAAALASPCLLLCLASVRVWIENKNFTISDRFICFILTVKQSQRRRRPLCFEGDRLKRSSTFGGKKCIRVTWLEDFLTSKWPGSFAALAPPLKTYLHCVFEFHF